MFTLVEILFRFIFLPIYVIKCKLNAREYYSKYEINTLP